MLTIIAANISLLVGPTTPTSSLQSVLQCALHLVLGVMPTILVRVGVGCGDPSLRLLTAGLMMKVLTGSMPNVQALWATVM